MKKWICIDAYNRVLRIRVTLPNFRYPKFFLRVKFTNFGGNTVDSVFQILSRKRLNAIVATIISECCFFFFSFSNMIIELSGMD